jgi:hypothetical protein
VGASSLQRAPSPSAGHSGTAPSRPQAPVAPSAPSAPAGLGAAPGSGGGFAGGPSALLVALLAFGGCALLRRHRCPSVVWRPAVFISLQEQPG